MKPIRHRGEVRRLELSTKIQRPEPATKPMDVPEALEKWDTHMREFMESGGRAPSFDERRTALLSILPDEIRRDVLMNVHMLEPGAHAPQVQQDEAYSRLRTLIQRQVELITQFDALHPKRSAVNCVQHSH